MSARAANAVPAFDVESVRRDFPILDQQINGHPLVYLDNAATTQKPECVIEAISNYYRDENVNAHRGVHTLSERATHAFEQARQTVAGFLASPRVEQVIWTSGTTADRYIGFTYHYAAPNSGAQATYTIKAPQQGRFQILVGTAPADERFKNRATAAPVEIRLGDQVIPNQVNYQGTQDRQFVPVGTIDVEKDQDINVVILTDGANGLVHLDAIQLLRILPAEETEPTPQGKQQ